MSTCVLGWLQPGLFNVDCWMYCSFVYSVRLKAVANGFHLTSTCARMYAFILEIGRMSVHLTDAQRSLHSQPISSRTFWHMLSTSKYSRENTCLIGIECWLAVGCWYIRYTVNYPYAWQLLFVILAAFESCEDVCDTDTSMCC